MLLLFMIQMGTRPCRRQQEGPVQHGSWVPPVGVYVEYACMHLQGQLNTTVVNATANGTKSFVISASCLSVLRPCDNSVCRRRQAQSDLSKVPEQICSDASIHTKIM